MAILRAALLLGLVLTLGACGSKFRTYDGPEVTRMIVLKEQRQLYLLHDDVVLRQYGISLGFNPVGHKFRQGDGRTPEGSYLVDKRNPKSRYHLSVGINYPRPQDVQVARMAGFDPGGDIFIHGRGPEYKRGKRDWTAGCIALTDSEIEEVYSMVRDGTPVTILP